MANKMLLVLIAVLTVILSALFAGAETGIYQLSRLRLRLNIEKKRLPSIILDKVMRDGTGLLLSILIGNSLTHYIVTSIVTYMLLTQARSPHAAELFATLVTVPILFVFAEVIPKNIFLYRADLLMPYLSPILYAFHKLLNLCGAIPLLKFILGLFGRLAGSTSSTKTVITSVQRHKVQAILQDTHEEGILSSVQTDIINRLVRISNVRMRSVMIPINNVQTVALNCDNSALLDKLKKHAFTRLPVVEGRPGNIVGSVNIYEALSSSEQFTDLRNFIKPIRKLDADTAVTDAINIMQRENQKIVLVTRAARAGRERHLGIVTMKDLVEELLGELAEW